MDVESITTSRHIQKVPKECIHILRKEKTVLKL
jgi:hypothetical protein